MNRFIHNQNNETVEKKGFSEQISPKVKKTIWKKPLLWVGVAAVAVVVIAGVFGARIFLPSHSPSIKLLQNQFGIQAEKVGAKSCAPLFSQSGDVLTIGAEHSALYLWNKEKPNNHAISAVVGQTYSDKITKGAGVIYAAPVNGHCEGTMVRTVVMQSACSDVANSQLPKGAKRQNDLTGVALFRLPDGGSIMMTPASQSSCVIVTTINFSDEK